MMILSRVSTKDLHFLPPCHYNTHQKDAPISKKPVSGGHARFCGRRIDMKVLTKRIIMSISGVVLCGMSVGMFKHAAFGVDPFQALMSGLDAVIPIRFGTLYVIVIILLLLFPLLMDRHKIGLATFINLFLLGYVVEFSQSLCAQLFPALGLGGRALLLVSALVPLSLASSLYFTADLGVSTYDAVALVWSDRQSRIPFPLCRILTDSACVLAGGALCLLSGMSLPQLFGSIGIATVITAFFMGPLIEFFNKTVSRPLLGAKTEANGK